MRRKKLNTPKKYLWYRIEDATAATGLSRSTLYGLAKKGRLVIDHVGRCAGIAPEELDRLLKSER